MAKPKFAKGNKVANGGKRAGAGRKPNVAKAALARLQVTRADAADRCFDILLEIAEDSTKSAAVRVQAAQYICDRVHGRPKQQTALTGEVITRVFMTGPSQSPPPGVGPKA